MLRGQYRWCGTRVKGDPGETGKRTEKILWAWKKFAGTSNVATLMSVPTSHLKVRCPVCRQFHAWSDNPHRPFCSEQCKKQDLGNWATEKYRIPVVDEEPGGDDPKGKPSKEED
jgi:uncharacterized protein